MYHEARDNHVRKDWINPLGFAARQQMLAGLFHALMAMPGATNLRSEMTTAITLKSPHELLAIVPFVLRAPDMASFFVWGQGWFLTS
jgi:hypothetical protein